MKLSVVIVNYNVMYFLEQCLLSVRKAMKGIDCEVFVVDNNSVDGSQAMVKEKFPEVHLIGNTENLGFSKANNQAMKMSSGEYVLLLNPDTVVEEDTFSKIINFMDNHPDAGGLGVKMVDGKGRFLPESKRGLPTPAVAFYKIFGLSRFFPRSKTFGRYHLGYLDNNETHKVDILSGAFMLLRRKALDKAGLLDEDFFMYGEDIDLSYRITLAGYNNYYYPETRIIHYKGESTKKSSINYVKMFYRAMIIFAEKHFSSKNAKLFSLLINLAVYFRAGLAILHRTIKVVILPLLDFILIYAGIYLIKSYWEQYIIYLDGGHYPVEFITIAVPLYILIWLLSVYFSGGYDRPVRLAKVYQGIFIGTVTILVIYGLLSEAYRYSRALIILGALWGMIIMTGIRLLFHFMHLKDFKIGSGKGKRFVIIGEKKEAERVASIVRTTHTNQGFIGLVSISGNIDHTDGFIGGITQLKEIVEIYDIDELIFCAKDVPANQIIDIMSDDFSRPLDYKIAPPEALSIIGSNTIRTSGDPYIIDLNSIEKRNNRRNKRIFDLMMSLFLLASLPVSIFLVKDKMGYMKNIFLVFAGRRSWTGYACSHNFPGNKLPNIKRGVLNPTDVFTQIKINDDTIDRLNLLYARDYKLSNELSILYRGFKNLGRQ